MHKTFKNIFIVAVLVLSSSYLHANSFVAGRNFFAKKDYVSSAAYYFQSYQNPKSAQEKFGAEWGLAQSLERLGLLFSASKYYSVIVRRGPRASNPYFRQAMERLGHINATVSIGQSHVVQLFKTRISSSSIPRKARGFYFYYRGIEEFSRNKYEAARKSFSQVSSSSQYYLKAQFHLGVISNLSGQHSRALSIFNAVESRAPRNSRGENLRILSNLNMARIKYEQKRYNEAVVYYARIPRDSDQWLQAHFEAAWAFFMVQNHYNALGNIHTIHAPFFIYDFYPESYILQSITYLRLCRYKEVEKSLLSFKKRYLPVFGDIRSMLARYRGNYKGFYNLVYGFRVGSVNSYKGAWAILGSLSKTDMFKEAYDTARFSDKEISRLSNFRGWSSSGLLDELRRFLSSKKNAALSDSGRRLYKHATGYFTYLNDLSKQTKLINSQMLLGKLDKMRSKLGVKAPRKKVDFIGGMRKLRIGESLEYWPFEGEYWEDELGNYVYNIETMCGRSSKKSKSKR